MDKPGGDKNKTRHEQLVDACSELAFISVTIARCIAQAQIIEGSAGIRNENSILGAVGDFTRDYFEQDPLLGDVEDLVRDVKELLEIDQDPDRIYPLIDQLCTLLLSKLEQQICGAKLRTQLKRNSSMVGNGQYFEDRITALIASIKTSLNLQSQDLNDLRLAISAPYLLASYAVLVQGAFDKSEVNARDSRFKLVLNSFSQLDTTDPEKVTATAIKAQIDGQALYTNRTVTPGGVMPVVTITQPTIKRPL